MKYLSSVAGFNHSNRVTLAKNEGLQFVVGDIVACHDDTMKYLLEILTTLDMLRGVRRVIYGDGFRSTRGVVHGSFYGYLHDSLTGKSIFFVEPGQGSDLV